MTNGSRWYNLTQIKQNEFKGLIPGSENLNFTIVVVWSYHHDKRASKYVKKKRKENVVDSKANRHRHKMKCQS